MEKEACTKMWVTILGGWFGLHKFMEKEIGKGILYFFTAGLFCFGWIIDSINAVRYYLGIKNTKPDKSLMPEEAVGIIDNGGLAQLEPDSDLPLNLSKGEKLYYVEKGSTSKSKTTTTGYKRSGSGYSIRLAKNLSTHIGGSNIQAVRQTETTVYNGILYLTNKRIVYTSKDAPFEASLSKITSITPSSDDEIMIQIGSKNYNITLRKADTFLKAYQSIMKNNKN